MKLIPLNCMYLEGEFKINKSVMTLLSYQIYIVYKIHDNSITTYLIFELIKLFCNFMHFVTLELLDP